jgi:hypothetical protein
MRMSSQLARLTHYTDYRFRFSQETQTDSGSFVLGLEGRLPRPPHSPRSGLRLTGDGV